MSLTCYWKNQKGELEPLKATDYDENLHKDRIFDKFTEAPVFYKKGHDRLNPYKKGQEQLKHYVRMIMLNGLYKTTLEATIFCRLGGKKLI